MENWELNNSVSANFSFNVLFVCLLFIFTLSCFALQVLYRRTGRPSLRDTLVNLNNQRKQQSWVRRTVCMQCESVANIRLLKHT